MKTLKLSIAALAIIIAHAACQSEGKNNSTDSLTNKSIDSSANHPLDSGTIQKDTSRAIDTTHMH